MLEVLEPVDASISVSSSDFTAVVAYWLAVSLFISVGIALALLDEPEQWIRGSSNSNPVAHVGDCLDTMHDFLTFGIFSALSGSSSARDTSDVNRRVGSVPYDSSCTLLARIGAWDHSVGEKMYLVAQSTAQRHVAGMITLSGDEATWLAMPLILILVRAITGLGSADIVGFCVEVYGDVLMCCVVEMGLKAIVRRDRPAYAKQATFFILPGEWWSFPSGHSMRASFLARRLSIDAYLRIAVFGPVVGPAMYLTCAVYIWAASVAWSRAAKGRHSPCDVVAGYIAGLFMAEIPLRVGLPIWVAAKLVAGVVCHAEATIMYFVPELRLEGFKLHVMLQIIWWMLQPWGLGLSITYLHVGALMLSSTIIFCGVSFAWSMGKSRSIKGN